MQNKREIEAGKRGISTAVQANLYRIEEAARKIAPAAPAANAVPAAIAAAAAVQRCACLLLPCTSSADRTSQVDAQAEVTREF